MSKFTSYGTCALCGKRTTKGAMPRHLQKCLAEHEPENQGGKTGRLFQLRIEGAGSPVYWMDAEVKASSTLDALDDFLRRQWLECCDHLSSFRIGKTQYTVPVGMMDIMGGRKPRTMDVKLYDVLGVGTTFEHEYDFGSTTYLKLRVTNERRGSVSGVDVRLVSRNEAPGWTCDVCGAPATQICNDCMGQTDNPFYCDTHAEDHGCDYSEMLLPVVNSPRMGVCGYTGPLDIAS